MGSKNFYISFKITMWFYILIKGYKISTFIVFSLPPPSPLSPPCFPHPLPLPLLLFQVFLRQSYTYSSIAISWVIKCLTALSLCFLSYLAWKLYRADWPWAHRTPHVSVSLELGLRVLPSHPTWSFVFLRINEVETSLQVAIGYSYFLWRNFYSSHHSCCNSNSSCDL